MLAFREPQHKEGDRRNHSGCGRDGKAGKVLCLFRGRNTALFRSDAAVARQSQRTTSQVDRGDDPARPGKFLQDDAISHQSRRNTE